MRVGEFPTVFVSGKSSAKAKPLLLDRRDAWATLITFCKQKNSLDPLKLPIRWGAQLPLASHAFGRVTPIGKKAVTVSKRTTGALRLTRLLSVAGILSGLATESTA